MPSIRYQMVRALFKVIGVNKMLDKQGEDFEKLLAEYQEKQKKLLKVPYKKLEQNFGVEKKNISGTVCYVVQEKGKTPKNAVLYLFGGGYILPPDPGDLILCSQIAKNANAEVWFPLYPMAPEHRLVETLQSTYRVYQEILKKHDVENVRLFGTSSGGGQALSLCMYIRHENLTVPLPSKLVLQSPGLQVPPGESQKTEMEKRKKSDVMIPPRFFDNIAPVLATGDAFLAAIRKFMEMGTLTAPLLKELIDHIDVYETEGTGKNRTQRIVIYYHFVGYIELPDSAFRRSDRYRTDTRQGVAVECIPRLA